jgi:hypothetical protein
LKKFLFIIFPVHFISVATLSQLRVSISSDISLMRNFKPQQQFWSFGQNVKFDFNPMTKDGLYVAMCYYSPGRFQDKLIAEAKSATTVPQQISFTNHAKLQLKEFSIGWKHFLKGNNEIEEGWNLFTLTGFGLVFGKAENSYSLILDTSLYNPPQRPLNGTGRFKRLSFDLGLGFEFPIADEIYFYSDARVSIPTTEYPSKFLDQNNNAPFPAMLSAGLRILF